MVDLQWVSTGTWGEFLRDIQGNNYWQDHFNLFYIYNDMNSDDIIKNSIPIDGDLLCETNDIQNIVMLPL